MKRIISIFLLVFFHFNSYSQYFSFANLVLKNIEFSNEELRANKLRLLELNSLAKTIPISITNNETILNNSDEINVAILNTIIYFSKNREEKKTLTLINEIENKLSESDYPKTIKTNFCFLKYLVFSHYDLFIDTTNFQSCFLVMDNLQRYNFLYTVYFLNLPSASYITKNSSNELLRLSSLISPYDYVKTLSLMLKENYTNDNENKINKILWLRDSTINKIISDDFKNVVNMDLKYNSFTNELELKEQIYFEKIISLNDLGYTARKNNDLIKSVSYFKEAINLQEKQKLKKIEPDLYVNYGLTLTLKSEFENAEGYYFKALKIYETDNNKIKMAELNNIIAKNYFLNSKTQLAINSCNTALSISNQSHDFKNMCESYLLLSEIYSAEQDYLEANKKFKLYSDCKKFYSDWLLKNAENKIGIENSYESINHDVIEEFQKQEQKKIELLKVKFESKQKEGDLIVLKKEAELREATLKNNMLEEEKAKQALILMEEKLKSKKKEVFALERQNKINSLQNSWIKNNLELATNKNKVLDQDRQINNMKVAEIKKNQQTLRLGLIGLFLLMLMLSYFFFKSVKHHKEVQKQNLNLSKKNEEILIQRNTISKKNEEIIDSINYALKIQTALLPTEEQFQKAFKEWFVFYKPKDIVSGDFYWIYNTSEYLFYATADCTGHGVPGGFMSMLGISLLNDIVKDKKIFDPSDVLDLMRVKIISELKQSDSTGRSKDGMDMTLCRLNKNKTELVFASANNDLWLIRNNELIEYKSDKQPVGFNFGAIFQFNQTKIDLKKDDIIITFSDGYSDQFGGEKGKKFKYKQLQKLVVANIQHPMKEQGKILKETIEDWTGELEQIDDMLVIGIKI